MSKENNWTKEWPNKLGFYWFYSYRYGKISCGQECEPELMFMTVRKVSGGVMYTADGQFVYKSEPEEAWFMKVELPELPNKTIKNPPKP